MIAGGRKFPSPSIKGLNSSLPFHRRPKTRNGTTRVKKLATAAIAIEITC